MGESWLPSSGCFCCPVECAISRPWIDTNPLPGFADPNRGYFSIPMSAFYLPVDNCRELSQMLVGEVEVAKAGDLAAIAFHEDAYKHLSSLHSKTFTRISASIAWQALAKIMSTGDSEAWVELEKCNKAIKGLTTTMAPVEEVYATFFGVETLRRQTNPPANATWVDETEKRFVQAQTNSFGSDFRELYKLLSTACYRAGLRPITILSMYAQEIFRTEQYDSDPGLSLQTKSQNRMTARLREGLDILNAIPYPLSELDQWTDHDWFEFMERWLVPFQTWMRGHASLDNRLEATLREDLAWWRESGLSNPSNGMNPVEGAMFIADTETLIGVVDPRSPPRDWRIEGKWLHSGAEDDLREQLLEAFSSARDRGRSLVIFQAPPDDNSAFVFLPGPSRPGRRAIPRGRVFSFSITLPDRAVLEKRTAATRSVSERQQHCSLQPLAISSTPHFLAPPLLVALSLCESGLRLRRRLRPVHSAVDSRYPNALGRALAVGQHWSGHLSSSSNIAPAVLVCLCAQSVVPLCILADCQASPDTHSMRLKPRSDALPADPRADQSARLLQMPRQLAVHRIAA